MKQSSILSKVTGKGIAYLSTYPPRECGIATFTKDLLDAIDGLNELRPPAIIAVNEKETIYNYDRRVDRSINASGVDLVNLQHEFGLFG